MILAAAVLSQYARLTDRRQTYNRRHYYDNSRTLHCNGRLKTKGNGIMRTSVQSLHVVNAWKLVTNNAHDTYPVSAIIIWYQKTGTSYVDRVSRNPVPIIPAPVRTAFYWQPHSEACVTSIRYAY